MSDKLIIALSAGTGGIAPSLIHLAQGFLKINPDIPGFFYYVGIAIFFLLGALVAIFLSETEVKRAFFLGIGLPALIATSQNQGPVVTASLISSSYAQTLSQPFSAVPPAKLNFNPAGDCNNCEIWFTNAAGDVIAKQIVNSAIVNMIQIPKGSIQFGVFDSTANIKYFPLPVNSSVTIELHRTYRPMKDLLRGLGAYNLKSYDADIRIK
jgi:hypothetical protein